MSIIKTNARSLDLTDDYAFTGTVTGAGGGKVLQVVSHENGYEQTSTSTSLTDLLSASSTTWEPAITPTVSTSKILVISSIHIGMRDNSDTVQNKRFELHCDSKVGSGSYTAFLHQEYLGQYYYAGTTRSDPMEAGIFNVNTKQFDHNTTDEIKFRWQYRVYDSNSKVGLHGGASDDKRSTVTFMEIA